MPTPLDEIEAGVQSDVLGVAGLCIVGGSGALRMSFLTAWGWERILRNICANRP